VSALVRCTYYLLILRNYKATGVRRTQSAAYLRSALIENNQCVSVMAGYCVVRKSCCYDILSFISVQIGTNKCGSLQCVSPPRAVPYTEAAIWGKPTYMSVGMYWQAFVFKKWLTFVFSWGARCWWHSWLRHCATSRKVVGSIPDGVIGIFQWHNPSCRTVALGMTQPLTEMSTRNISWG
jgi:hypothetical protein